MRAPDRSYEIVSSRPGNTYLGEFDALTQDLDRLWERRSINVLVLGAIHRSIEPWAQVTVSAKLPGHRIEPIYGASSYPVNRNDDDPTELVVSIKVYGEPKGYEKHGPCGCVYMPPDRERVEAFLKWHDETLQATRLLLETRGWAEKSGSFAYRHSYR